MLKDISFSSFIKKIKANYWKLWMQSQISLIVTSHCHLLCNSTKVTMFLSQVLLVKILTELQEASTISDPFPSNWVPERRHYGTGFGAQTDDLGSSEHLLHPKAVIFVSSSYQAPSQVFTETKVPEPTMTEKALVKHVGTCSQDVEWKNMSYKNSFLG